jgi:hypothetical protein
MLRKVYYVSVNILFCALYILQDEATAAMDIESDELLQV